MSAPATTAVASPIPARAGVGLRPPHYRELLATLPALGFLEVHSENYFGDGGQPLYYLEQARRHYPLSLHGVGMSLGSVDALNHTHLAHLKKLIARVEPGLVSEHLCWSSVDGRFLNDLLPLPYTEEALDLVCSHVEQAQDYLQRQILLENLSSYLEFTHSTMPEWTFLAAVAERTGCGILLDVNNIHVAATNHRFDPIRYLYAMPLDAVKEIHLAGFTIDHGCLIDTHSAPVAEPVWVLYRAAVARFGALPTLVEWDSELPAFDVLVGEALRAQAILEHHHAYAA